MVRPQAERQVSSTHFPSKAKPIGQLQPPGPAHWWGWEPQENPGDQEVICPHSLSLPFLSGEQPWLMKGIASWCLPTTPPRAGHQGPGKTVGPRKD